MNFTYVIILAAVLAISPFVLRLASNQGKKTKQSLKSFFILMLSAQVVLGFFNWKTYPDLLLGLFFGISLVQFFLLLINKISGIVVILNLLNSVFIFAGMIRVSNALGFQVTNISSIASVFLVLLGNVIGLLFINKDKNLLQKYLR